MIADKITNRINEIKKLGVTRDSIYRVKNLTDYLDSYMDLSVKVIKDLDSLDIDSKSELYQLVSDIRNTAEKGKRSALYIYGENLTDTLWEFVEPTANKIDERWLKRKAFLENSPVATKRLIALEEAAYNSIKLTKETFEKW